MSGNHRFPGQSARPDFSRTPRYQKAYCPIPVFRAAPQRPARTAIGWALYFIALIGVGALCLDHALGRVEAHDRERLACACEGGRP
jgi:hypothetical protein